tara:strand:+ start:60 stop:860 length:801 start_codon:yes stop_codon:yes gene_type:complete
MIDINAQYLDDCRMEAIRGASAEEMYELAFHNPLFANFFITYLHEHRLNQFLATKFDTVRKPQNENGSESSADSICTKDGKEFRFQLKSISSTRIKKNYKIDEGKSTTIGNYRVATGIHIKCTPNHSRPFYKRNELDVIVADLWPLTGKPTFVYNTVDNLSCPTEEQKVSAIRNNEKRFYHDDNVREYITPSVKFEFICMNNFTGIPSDYTEEGNFGLQPMWRSKWTEDIDVIIERLTSPNYKLRDYTNHTEEIKAEVKKDAVLVF